MTEKRKDMFERILGNRKGKHRDFGCTSADG